MSELRDCATVFAVDDATFLRHGTRDYLEKMSQELSDIAFKNGWDSLAVIFEMARQEAERMRRASDEHLIRT
jgi:hypothetical protein